MPSHSASPSGTIAIGIGIFPDICIDGSDVCLTVGRPPDRAISPDDIDIPVVVVIFIVVVLAAALASERRSLASTTAAAIPIAARATRALWSDMRLLIERLLATGSPSHTLLMKPELPVSTVTATATTPAVLATASPRDVALRPSATRGERPRPLAAGSSSRRAKSGRSGTCIAHMKRPHPPAVRDVEAEDHLRVQIVDPGIEGADGDESEQADDRFRPERAARPGPRGNEGSVH
jgi:hypothetical protein